MKLSVAVMLAGMLTIGAEFCRQRSCSCLAGQATNGAITIKELRCEYAQNPLGIDTKSPRFSWILESNRRSQMQSAYRILVAGSEEKLDKNTGDKWDSSKVFSEKSVNIPYEGQPLTSGETCYWKVRVWDKNGKASEWSKPATFEMGLLKKSDWSGSWITSLSVPNFVEGKFGRAVPLDGKSEGVSVAHYNALKSKRITIAAWIKQRRFTDRWQNIVRKEDGGPKGGIYFLELGQEFGKRGIWFGAVIGGKFHTKCTEIEGSRIADGSWHHVAGSFDGENIRIYLDGSELQHWPVRGEMSLQGQSELQIGYWGPEWFDGSIDEVRIYNRGLSADEIRLLVKENASLTKGLTGRWKMDGTLTNDIPSGKSGSFVNQGGGFSPLLRKEVNITRKVRSARAYFSGLGWGELYVNGKKVSDEVLSPAFTDYFKEVKYRTYDVTDFLKQGPNAIGIMLGNGWFSTQKTLSWEGGGPWARRPQAILQVTVTYDDGTQRIFSTDDSWKAATGSIIHNYVKLGERYDARLEKPLWNTVGYDDGQWRRAAAVSSPGGRLSCQTMPDMKVKNAIRPTKLTNPKDGVWVFEFDRFFAGWVRLNVKGKAGTKIRLEYSSRIFDNGLIDKGLWPGDKETDVYILKGDPNGEVYEPRFTFHPVQYVQVTGLEQQPTLETVTGREVYNDVDLYGNFTCSNELFNRIHQNVERTLRIALKGFILDCLHREPIMYNEPASISASAWTRKFMPNLWIQSARNMQLGSFDDGYLSDIVPLLPGMRRAPDASLSVNYPMLIWYLYHCYDDRRLLDQHYPTVKAWVDFMATLADGRHIVKKGWLGDHMLPGRTPGQEQFRSKETPPEFIWTCFYYHNARTISNMARVLGKEEDKQRYADLAREIKKTINETWLDRETSHYASRSQTSDILPLAIGIVPREHKQQLIKNIARTITEVDGGKLRVGHAGLPGFIESLVDNGLGEIMYNVVNQTEYPGWGYMVSQGATTVWESWGRKTVNYAGEDSMTMLAGISRFFYNDIAGIGEPDYYGPQPVAPGYGHIAIKPHVLGDLKHASASIKTVRGIVSTSWKRTDNSLTLEVAIPVNSTAKVSVPKIGLKNVSVSEGNQTVWKHGKFLPEISGITQGNETDEFVTFENGSGSYTFVLKGQK